MIKLTGRSPRLVQRWHDLGLFTGFSLLRRWSPKEMASEYRRSDDLPEVISPPRRDCELWVNDLGIGSLPDQFAGEPFKLSDLGTETIVNKLPKNHSAGELACVLFKADFSLAAIGRVIQLRHSLRVSGRAERDRPGLDWLRWAIFKTRWLERQPSAALLSLPAPDLALHRGVRDRPVQSPACPELQVAYAQALLASYLMVDSITWQAVRMAQQRDIALIISIEPSTVGSTFYKAPQL